jgi:hypothetical protein
VDGISLVQARKNLSKSNGDADVVQTHIARFWQVLMWTYF